VFPIKLPFLPISINPSVPLLLASENEDEMIEHEAKESSGIDPIRIIDVLMN
jgi:hypothetical protein